MYNETSSESTTAENDSGGGSKNVKETESKKEVVYSDKNGKNEIFSRSKIRYFF